MPEIVADLPSPRCNPGIPGSESRNLNILVLIPFACMRGRAPPLSGRLPDCGPLHWAVGEVRRMQQQPADGKVVRIARPKILMISIIIPTLNEEQALPLLLDAIRRQGADHEVIVADGGSEDRTVAIALDHGARTLFSPPFRWGRSRRSIGAARNRKFADSPLEGTGFDAYQSRLHITVIHSSRNYHC